MPRARVLMGTPEFAKSRNERKKVEMPRGQAPHRSRSGRGSIGGLHCSTSVVDRRTRLAVGGVAFAVPEEGLVDVNNNRVLDVDQVIEPIAELDALVGFRGGRFFTSLKSPLPPARGVPRALGAARAPDRGLGCESSCFANNPTKQIGDGLGELEIKPESLRYIVCSTPELLEDSSVNIERGSWTRRGGRLRFRLTTRFWWATVSASQWEF
jgi:hypothetical protein